LLSEKRFKSGEGRDVTLVAMGVMVSVAWMQRSYWLTRHQARLLDMHTVKPLDGDALLQRPRHFA